MTPGLKGKYSSDNLHESVLESTIKCDPTTAWKVSLFRVILVWMWENADQNNSENGLFLRSDRIKKKMKLKSFSGSLTAK